MYMTLAAIRDMYKDVDTIFEVVHKHAYMDQISNNMTLKRAAIKDTGMCFIEVKV